MHKTSKKAVQNQLFKKLFCYSFFIQFINNEEYLFTMNIKNMYCK